MSPGPALRAASRRVRAHLWYLARANSVKRHSTIPIEVGPAEHDISPITGLGRRAWRNVALGLLDNVLQYSDGLRSVLRLPPSRAAGYPIAALIAQQTHSQEAYVEGVARTLLLASTLLHDEPELELHGGSVAAYYRQLLLRGVDASDVGSFGKPPPTKNQRTVEAALIAIALSKAPSALWHVLDRHDRQRVLDWLWLFREAPVSDSNWHWFAVLVNTFLKVNGRPVRRRLVEDHLDRLLSMHADAGWVRDGLPFDFYSAWAMQCFPLIWATWDGDSFPAQRAAFYRHNDEFLQTYPHILSRQGHMPAWGRSLCYRFAAAAPLAAAFLRPTPPAIDPGFARRLASGNLLQFIQRPGVIADGLLTLGFYEENAALVDRYSCTGSPYWSALAFISLTVPPDSPYWTAVENEGFWPDPPELVRFGSTGLYVTHDRNSGASRLYAPQPSARRGDPRYHQPYFEAL